MKLPVKEYYLSIAGNGLQLYLVADFEKRKV